MWFVTFFVLALAVAYYFGKHVGKVRHGTTCQKVTQDKYDDDDGTWHKISPEVNDASCECKLLAEPLVLGIEEVRDIGCQSQVTYRRKLLQPRFQPAPLQEGAFPEPSRTKVT